MFVYQDFLVVQDTTVPTDVEVLITDIPPREVWPSCNLVEVLSLSNITSQPPVLEPAEIFFLLPEA
jgi:hypothetical protein